MTFPTVRIGSVFDIRNGGTPSSSTASYWDGDVPWVTPADLGRLSGKEISRGERYISDEGLRNSNAQLVPARSIVLSIRAPIGHVALTTQPLAFNQGCRALIPSSAVNPDFAYYALLSHRQQLQAAGQGTTFLELGRAGLVSERLPLPDPSTQERIANFLDRETARIDQLIEKKRRLVDHLGEKRIAVINQAATRGLNHRAPLQPSGVQWLGEVPTHWSMVKIKRIAKIQYGIGEPPEYREHGVPLIRATNVRAGRIIYDGMVYVDPDDIPSTRIAWLSPGDIIVVRSGAYTGDSALIREEHSPSIAGFDMVLTPTHCDPEFLQYALLTSYMKQGQMDLEKLRAAQPHLNAGELGSCRILLPPRKEQREIVEFIDEELATIDTVLDRTVQSIIKLRELRSAFIAATVSGQLSVRGKSMAESPRKGVNVVAYRTRD